MKTLVNPLTKQVLTNSNPEGHNQFWNPDGLSGKPLATTLRKRWDGKYEAMLVRPMHGAPMGRGSSEREALADLAAVLESEGTKAALDVVSIIDDNDDD